MERVLSPRLIRLWRKFLLGAFYLYGKVYYSKPWPDRGVYFSLRVCAPNQTPFESKRFNRYQRIFLDRLAGWRINAFYIRRI